eukprot:2845400-Rhodomonas_salina.2
MELQKRTAQEGRGRALWMKERKHGGDVRVELLHSVMDIPLDLSRKLDNQDEGDTWDHHPQHKPSQWGGNCGACAKENGGAHLVGAEVGKFKRFFLPASPAQVA